MINRRKGLGILFCLSVMFMLLIGSTAMAAEVVTITGMVVPGKQGPVLKAEDRNYLLKGKIGDDFLGKQAKVTGQVGKEADGTQFIVVKSIEPIG